MGVGELLKTKVNVNVGTSQALDSPETEVEKALAAVEAGADTVMDLSTGGDLDLVRRKILDSVRVPVGSVPIYNAAVKKDLTSQGLFDALEKHRKGRSGLRDCSRGSEQGLSGAAQTGPADNGGCEPRRFAYDEVHRRDRRGEPLL